MEDAGRLIGVIGDEDTVTGFLLAGIGQRDAKGANFLVVDAKTTRDAVEAFFEKLITRGDIGILLMNQPIADMIRPAVTRHMSSPTAVPVVVEVPSKDAPYDADKDPVLRRVLAMLGETE